ncbi:hypothetical protein QJS66_07215 [Kocuria rhizophila]|nr:hypothetical protein QJS66_07215 [Kocuria rhizophila]
MKGVHPGFRRAEHDPAAHGPPVRGGRHVLEHPPRTRRRSVRPSARVRRLAAAGSGRSWGSGPRPFERKLGRPCPCRAARIFPDGRRLDLAPDRRPDRGSAAAVHHPLDSADEMHPFPARRLTDVRLPHWTSPAPPSVTDWLVALWRTSWRSVDVTWSAPTARPVSWRSPSARWTGPPPHLAGHDAATHPGGQPARSCGARKPTASSRKCARPEAA